MRNRLLTAILPAIVVITVATGCGSGDDLSDGAATALQADVAAVSAAVRASDPAKARTALTALREEVSKQLAAGAISGDRAREILTAAGDVAADLPAPKPTATRSPTPKPIVQAPAPESERDRGKGKGNGESDKDDD